MNNNRSSDEKTRLCYIVCHIHLYNIILLYLAFMFILSISELMLEPGTISTTITSNASKILEKLESTSIIFVIFSAIAYKILELTNFFSIFLMIVVAIYLTLDVTCGCLRTGEFLVSSEKDKKSKLLKLPTWALMASLGISAIPTGISLVICAIYGRLDLIEAQMSGIEIYIAFAGISIIFISFLSALVIEGEIEENDTDTPTGAQGLVEPKNGN